MVGSDVVLLPEGQNKVALVRKAYRRTNLLDGERGFTQQLLCMSQPAIDNVLMRQTVTREEIEQKAKVINDFFTTLGDSPSDPITKVPTQEQVEWSAKVATAQEKLVRHFELDGIAYYYHGYEDHFENLQGGFIVGHSLLTAAGVHCAGEGDIKTSMAMRICDLLGKGGSFCEIVTTDYEKQALVIGHDGPFHIDITNEKPIMRGMTLYHGKRGNGIPVEASVRPGPVTTFAVVQGEKGVFKLIASEGMAYKADGMTIGNTEHMSILECLPTTSTRNGLRLRPLITFHCRWAITSLSS